MDAEKPTTPPPASPAPAAEEPIIPLPTAQEKETKFLARSGAVVILRLIDTGRFEVKLDTRGDYTATLLHDGDTFSLHPAPGVHAIGGTGLSATDLYERF